MFGPLSKLGVIIQRPFLWTTKDSQTPPFLAHSGANARWLKVARGGLKWLQAWLNMGLMWRKSGLTWFCLSPERALDYDQQCAY